MKKNQYTLLFIFLLLGKMAFAQLSFKINYDVAYFSPDKINSVLSAYNSKDDLTITPFKNVRYTNGLEMGVRYRMDLLSFETGWGVISTSKKQEIFTDATKKDKKFQTLNFAIQNYNAGLTFHFGRLGLGANYGQNFFNMTRRFAQDSKRNKILEKSLSYGTTTFYLNYEGRMNSMMSFAIRPYYQLPLAKLDLSAIRDGIYSNSAAQFPDQQQDMTMIGLKLIFFNGKQTEN